MNATLIVAAVLAYLMGSLSFAVIVSKLMGLSDPRSYGSGNPGATNVLRSGNKKAAILTLLLDAVKGWIPVVIAQQMGLSDATVAVVGLAAFLGHLYPVFFRFAGGKGVATAAGVLIGFQPAFGGMVLLVWLAVAGIFRYSSLAALVAALSAPMLYLLGMNGWWAMAGPVLLAIVVMSVLLLWRHRQNIQRLLAGQEGKIGSKK